MFISAGESNGPLHCSSRVAARPSQNWAVLKAAFKTVGELRLSNTPLIPLDRGKASVNALPGSWQLEQLVLKSPGQASLKEQALAKFNLCRRLWIIGGNRHFRQSRQTAWQDFHGIHDFGTNALERAAWIILGRACFRQPARSPACQRQPTQFSMVKPRLLTGHPLTPLSDQGFMSLADVAVVGALSRTTSSHQVTVLRNYDHTFQHA